MKPEGNVFQQGVETFSFGGRSLPIKHLGYLLAKTSACPPTGMPVVPKEMSQFVGQGETLLVFPVRAVQKDQPVAPAGRQTSP
jgi:hypothetical protein